MSSGALGRGSRVQGDMGSGAGRACAGAKESEVRGSATIVPPPSRRAALPAPAPCTRDRVTTEPQREQHPLAGASSSQHGPKGLLRGPHKSHRLSSVQRKNRLISPSGSSGCLTLSELA
ncbi:unnamed protein product [Boreogadus saida]